MGKAVHGIGKRCAVENFLVIPTNATLGSVALQATARDGGNMTRSNVMENVTASLMRPEHGLARTSQALTPDWNNASMLPNRPPVGLYRHQTSLLTVCVMDADYDLNTPAPVFLTSREPLET